MRNPLLSFGLSLIVVSCSTGPLVEVPKAPELNVLGGESWTGDIRYVHEYVRILQSLGQAGLDSPMDGSGVVCPPSSFSVVGEFVTPGDVLYSASGITIFNLAGSTMLLKMSDADPYNVEGIWREKAAMAVLDMTSFAVSPRQFEFDETGSLLGCDLRSLLVERVKGSTLFDLVQDKGPMAFAIVQKIGRKAIDALEKVHSIGLIHGDIHGGNIIYCEDENEMKLIDFGRSRPYITLESRHVFGESVPLDEQLDPLVLSPQELEGFTTSRADDLFRLAETLVSLIDGDRWLVDVQTLKIGHRVIRETVVPSIPELIRRKMSREFSPNIPVSLQKFYQSTLAIGFSETPDYKALVALLDE